MDDTEKNLLAQFHHTISEQLNARLSESPRFFGLLIVVSTAYGYVLSQPNLSDLLTIASVLFILATIWASWYLAALGYAFRYLQNSQHLIEHALGWIPKYVPAPENGRQTGEPPWPPKTLGNILWLLPGIYHPNAVGLYGFLMIIYATYCYRAWNWWPHGYLIMAVAICVVGSLMLILGIHLHYLFKFSKRRHSL